MRISVPSGRLDEIGRRWHIRKWSFFGSVLRDDFRDDSDVDVLVEFEAEHTPGWEIVDIEDERSALLGGRRVHTMNPKYLNHRLRDRVLHSSVVQYDSTGDALA
ncbi:MAG: nucleotidyltransferase [Phycisphaerales bacterium]|nr:nucleotidyltransferase [Phycisphaerales bacterium]